MLIGKHPQQALPKKSNPAHDTLYRLTVDLVRNLGIPEPEPNDAAVWWIRLLDSLPVDQLHSVKQNLAPFLSAPFFAKLVDLAEKRLKFGAS
ncbi:hypothetical protein DI243_13845 [Paenibacillus polymyxa]|nr:hypothetical protein DI243_13845 [Paenibacillus polymyxa]